MNVAHGDIWEARGASNGWVVVPTNMLGVMGRGIAAQAKARYPDVAKVYREDERAHRGFHPYWWSFEGGEACNVVMLAVKEHYADKADPLLIAHGLGRLVEWAQARPRPGEVYVPLLGAGHGELDHGKCQALIERFLGPQPGFTLVLADPSTYRKYPSSFAPAVRSDFKAMATLDEWPGEAQGAE